MSPKQLPLIAKYGLHPDIIDEIRQGNLEFIHEEIDGQESDANSHRCCCLVFEILKLRERKSAVYLYWHGPDPKTWALEGLRFYVQREHDGRGSDSLWSPSSGNDNAEDVDEFIAWLRLELDD